MRSHSFVERGCAGISLNHYPGRTEFARLRRCPFEQQATNSSPYQSRFNKELQKVCVRTGDLDLSQANDGSILLGDLKAGGLELVEINRQFSAASRQERLVVTPMGLRAEA